MPPTLSAGSSPAVLLWVGLACTLAACAPDAPAPARVVASDARLGTASARVPVSPRLPAARPASADSLAPAPEPVVFDTTEPPEAVRQIAPRPPPGTPAPPPPAPRPPAPRPPAPRPPARGPAPAGAGSCDVRPAEDYCFAYAGSAWTPEDAGAHCDAAPGASFRAGPCPTSGRIATCTFRRASDPEREIVYTTYAPADPDLARLACPGTFETVE